MAILSSSSLATFSNSSTKQRVRIGRSKRPRFVVAMPTENASTGVVNGRLDVFKARPAD
jgi:hypothetical protein